MIPFQAMSQLEGDLELQEKSYKKSMFTSVTTSLQES